MAGRRDSRLIVSTLIPITIRQIADGLTAKSKRKIEGNEDMAELTTKQRKKLPNSKFAGPDRSYPVDTHNRAANAKARAQQQYNKGAISKSELQKIDAKANKKLGKKK